MVRVIRRHGQFPFFITTAAGLQTSIGESNDSRALGQSTARPTHCWTNQHGQAHQQVDQAIKHNDAEGKVTRIGIKQGYSVILGIRHLRHSAFKAFGT